MIIDDPYNIVQKMPDILPPRWVDVRDKTALADMARLRAEAAAALQRMIETPPPPDPLVQAQQRIAELEVKLRDAQRDLEIERARNNSTPIHQRKLEKR